MNGELVWQFGAVSAIVHYVFCMRVRFCFPGGCIVLWCGVLCCYLLILM